mgnify:CR=1 FL=1
MNEGRLVYLMGPSGAGKDSVLQGLQQSLAGRRLRICLLYTSDAADE